MSLADAVPDDFFLRECEGLGRYVYRIVWDVDDSADIVQESFLRFYTLRAKEDNCGNDRALLFRLARNLAIDCVRERKKVQRLPGNVIHLAPASPEDLAAEQEQNKMVHSVLKSLNQRERECLSLRNSGLSYGEIATILNVKSNCVGQVLARALRSFRKRYAELQTTRPQFEESRPTRRG
jgi:RNA polymerase sigma-70 factor (ECF subfamily)